MAKRYPALKQYSRASKKPKLEISFSNQSNESTSTVIKKQPNRFDNPGPSKQISCDFDDDDDDIILLASQQIENWQNSENDINLNILTFSNFGLEISTSTQKPTINNNDVLSDLFEDGIDNDIDELKQIEEYTEIPRQHKDDENFKIPILPTQKISTQMIPSQKIIEKTHESQVQFLINRLDTANKNNDELTKELENYKEKIETKDGEVSMLRNELRHTKNQIDRLRMEKIQDCEKVKVKWQEKIDQIKRHMKVKETELELKTSEVSRLKIKCLDETQRFATETSFGFNEHVRAERAGFTDQRIFQLDISTSWIKNDANLKYIIPLEIFDNSMRIGATKFQENISKELEKVQSILARLQSFETLTKDQRFILEETAKKSIRLVIPDFWNYVHSLEFPEFESTDCDYLLERKNDTSQKSLFQADPLYVNERAILFRRYIAGLSVISCFLPNMCQQIFIENHKEYTLIQIMIDALQKLGYSNEVASHLGTLEAFSMLLKVLIETLGNNEKFHKSLIKFLKCLIFSRPNDRTFVQLSQCMLCLSDIKNNNTIINLLCTQSGKKSFSYDERDKIYRFSPSSCILQVFGGLLETVFPINCRPSAIQFKLLTELCFNHVKFLSNLFSNCSEWIQQLSSDDVDTNSNKTTSSTAKSTCECYNKLCKSFIILFYQLLQEWTGVERNEDEYCYKIIQTVNLGSRVLYDIFHSNFKRSIFSSDGYATKHRLYMICDNLYNNFNRLKIEHCNRVAIETIKKSHILTDSLQSYKTSPKPNQVDMMDVDTNVDILNEPCIYENLYNEIVMPSNWVET